MIVNFEKYIVVSVIVLFVIYVGYFLSFLRFNDYEYVIDSMVKLENDNLNKRVLELEDALNLKSNSDFIVSRVLIRDIYNFYDEIIIDTSDVDIGDAVFNQDGLIGIVADVRDERTIVSLLTGDVNVSVSVNGIYGNLNHGLITMMDKYADINIGDKVYTSGLTLIPHGIYVGEVISVSEDELGKKANIKLVANNNLNYVGVARSNAS